jgi:serine phosphatase RsbU (regulator of sigma subunit)/CHASE3 domain sensor protein
MGTARQARWPLAAAAAAIFSFVIVFALGGVLARSVLSGAFQKSEDVRAARLFLSDVVKQQLDEETGLRGFAITGQALFLEPYRAGRRRLPETLAKLRGAVDALQLPHASERISRAAAINREWLASVAEPLVTRRLRDSPRVERHGKALLDSFRAETTSIDALLYRRGVALSDDVQRAIWRVGLFVFIAIVALLTLATSFVYLQLRLTERIEVERLRRQEESARAAELRAAYRAEKRIADTLQSAFSQRPLPALPNLRFSATYVPAAEETMVGGDWYDVLELPNHRVLFAIGDVAGHGIDAAVTMNHARQSLVSSGLLESDPAALLSRVNADLFTQRAPMVTALAGFADSETHEFIYAAAGHPPPLLLEPNRFPRLLECGDPPLGVLANCAYRTRRVRTVAGAMLVLYTDGAIEHSRNALEGEKLLLEAVARAKEVPGQPPATVIHDAIFRSRSVHDDVAILTIAFAADSAASVPAMSSEFGVVTTVLAGFERSAL